jgi:putative flavoprotein involved in K+ transport
MSPIAPARQRFNTVVIGAGQAGLAAGYYLARAGADFLILDAANRVGDSWRNRWDSLRLFTQARWNDLPGMPFPLHPGQRRSHLPGKDEMAEFLERYAAEFSLPVRLGVKVDRLYRDGRGFVIDAEDAIEADNVVVATGPFQKPRLPGFAGQLHPDVFQLHSSAYRNPGQVPRGDALVVGAAASGCQIAMELASERRVYLAGRSVGREPSGLVARWLFDPLVPWLFSQPRTTFIGKRMYRVARGSGHPLVGLDYGSVERAGVERVPRVSGARGGRPVLDDGRALEVRSVIWSTGYDIDFSWIDLPIFEKDGYPRHHRGVVEEVPGLYFIGLIFLFALRSHVIFGAGKDAKYVTDALLRRE